MPAAPDPGMNLLIAGLPEGDRQRWLATLEPVKLALGQVLYEPGEIPRHAYFPTTAVVSLLYMTEAGACDEVAVIGLEGVVGVSRIMGGRPTSGTAVVQCAGWGFRLPAQTIKDEFERSAAVMRLLLGHSLELSAQVAQTAVCSRHHTLDQRLCRRLLQGLDRQQSRELVITQEQLAGLLGVRRESITLEANKLQKAGVVRYSRGHIHVLDRLGLERRVCECYAAVNKQSDRWPVAATMVLPAPAAANRGHALADPQSLGKALAPSRSLALADLATYLQQMREQERGDLARELHDELGALLTRAKLDVASLKASLPGVSAETEKRLRHLGEMINRGIAFSRRVVEDLHPSSLANLGLTASLEILAREFGENAGIAMATHFDDIDIDDTAQLTVYRVVQESLNNASKYAKASEAQVVLLDCEGEIVLTVHDNGRGFDTAATGMSSHGLAGMRHRVESCGGQFTVTSEPGKGTVIAAVLPKQVGCSAASVKHVAPRTLESCVTRRPASVSATRRLHAH